MPSILDHSLISERYFFPRRDVLRDAFIVNNGDVTLEGVVDREMDKNIAGITANGVAGVFSVTNNLRVADRS